MTHLVLWHACRDIQDTEVAAFRDQLGAVDGVVAVPVESSIGRCLVMRWEVGHVQLGCGGGGSGCADSLEAETEAGEEAGGELHVGVW